MPLCAEASGRTAVGNGMEHRQAGAEVDITRRRWSAAVNLGPPYRSVYFRVIYTNLYAG